MRAKFFKLAIITILAVVAAASDVSAQPDSFALRAGRILPVSPDLPAAIDDGVIIVRDGRIVAIGSEDDVDIPPDVAVIDFSDGTVTPGFVAAASDLGERHRGDESMAAGYQAVDSFDPFGNYAGLLAAGVTTVHVNPGTHRLLTGQGAVVKLGGPPQDRVLRAQADLTVNLDPAVNKPPLDVTYSFPASADVAIPLPRRQRPASRIGQLLALDEAIRDALAGKRVEPYSIHPPALAQAWKDELPLRIRADRAADVLGATKFLGERNRSGYVVSVAEADRVAEAIRAAKVPLVYQPRNQFRSLGGDIGTDPNALPSAGPDFEALEGVTLALSSAIVADLRLTAAHAAGAGLKREDALQAITRVPAEILGVDDRVGSLAVGKDADLVVLTGDPLAVSSHVQRVYVRGRSVFEPPAQGAIVVKADMVWAGPGKWISDGQILTENGKIVAVGRTVPHPPFARVIDVRPGGFVTPGFIDAHGHLGLEGDRTSGTSDLRLSKLVGAADVTDTRVAAAGITTVLMAPYAISNTKGATCAAVKTSGNHRSQRVIRDPAAVLFDVSQSDPLAVAETLSKALALGQKYVDAWTKYDKDLKEFLEKKAKGEKPKAGEDKKEEESKEPAKPDPVTGTWEATITGVPMPDPVSATIVVQLKDSTVEGRVTQSSLGLTGRISGHFDGKHLSAEIVPDMDIPGLDPPIKLEVDLVEEDRFKGTISAMGITAEVAGNRVDKTSVEFSVTSRRRRGKDGRPLPPKVDQSMEPLKALLEKKIPAVVKASTPAQIREVLAVLIDKHKLPVTLVGAEGASSHAAVLAEKKVTVVVPPNVLRKRQYRDYHQADDLSRHKVPIAFQSNLEDGARHIPAVVLYAVERGLDAEAALEALTVGAAKAYKIDDRVGTIEPGKDADMVIFSGHPFQEAGRVLRIVVDGKEVRP
ncbi:MAG: amidohydrolase family protein [Planctomycetes bacterium]|nr:amidohydrolase family protein [Planctomycetota bacterium]MBL7039038.1 amidohydrolase family protein [Pirellulaceae bacterium]